MAKRGITLELRARNMLARGLRGASRALRSFGKAAVNVGKTLAKGFLVAGAAVAGLAVKALQAWSVQEKAEKSMEAALRSYGEELDGNLAKVKAFASAIQDETGVADENTIARAAQLRMLGVETDALEDAIKATIALKSAGLEGATAVRAVAAARAGDFSMLTRYIPALRTATSEAEKARIVNDFVTRGYQQQKDELQTVSGMWGLFKGRVGDAFEEIGRGLSKNERIIKFLKDAGEAVKRFGERIRDYVDSRHFEEVQKSIEGIIRAIAGGGEDRGEALKALGGVVVAAFRVAAETAGGILKRVAPEIGRKIAEGFRKVGAVQKTARVIAPESKEEIRLALQQLGLLKAGSLERLKNAWAVKKQIQLNRRKSDAEEESLGITKEETAAQKTLADAIDRVRAVAARNVKEKAEPEKEMSAADKAFADEVAAAESARDRIDIAQQKAVDDREAREKALRDNLDRLETEHTDAAKREAQERVNAAREEMRAKEELAAKSVRSYIDEVRQRRRAENQWERDQERAAKLKRRAHLTPGQREFIDAVEKVGQAKSGVSGMAAKVTEAEQQLASLQEQNRTMVEVRDELRGVHGDLTKLLAAG